MRNWSSNTCVRCAARFQTEQNAPDLYFLVWRSPANYHLHSCSTYSKSTMKLTRSQLLDKMEEGQRYTATRLAQAIRKPTYTVREWLHALVRDGFVTRCDESSRVMRFQRTASVISADDVESCELHDAPTTSVATFPIKRVFSGTLTDYDLNAHRVLAMLTRR